MLVPATLTSKNTLKVKEIVYPKKITGTKFASILGKNEYSSPFETWCDMLHTYEFPFEDTMFTVAGKTIEPYQAIYAEQLYRAQGNLVTPTQMFGENYFSTTHGNFFSDEHFGGMWDYLLYSDDKVNAVFEMKTASEKKRKLWENDVPEHYALQAALYAYLLNVDRIIMVVSFLKFPDYSHPSAYLPNALNTECIEFSLKEKYPNFENDYIKPAIEWWNNHVLTGESPIITSENDKLLLKEIINSNMEMEQTNLTSVDTTVQHKISSVMSELEENVTYFNSVSDEVTKAYVNDLDEAMAEAYKDIIVEEDPSDNVLERHFLKLSNLLYFVGSRAEKLGVYSDVSKAAAKEAYNNAYLENQNKIISVEGKKSSKPTVAENQAIAENSSIYHSTVNTIYDRSYKILKFKIDAAYEMVKTLSKIISKRMQDYSREHNQDSNLTFINNDNII